MKFNISMTEQDFIKFNVRHLKYSKLGKTLNILLWIFTALLTVFIGQMLFSFAKSDGLPFFVPAVETAILVVVLLIYMLVIEPKTSFISVKLMLKLQKKDGKLPYSECSIIEISEDEIIDESPVITVRAKYDEIVNVYCYDDAMYLYINSQQAIILPFNQLGDEKEKVIAFLNSKVECENISK